MAKVTFYPLGNADSSLIEFADGRLMLIDYFHSQETEDEEDKRINLREALESVLEDKDRNDFDVVAFTHRDSDHVQGAEDFFWLEHAKKYQGEERPKIREMWVPAYYILETGLEDSALVIQHEARHRLKEGKNIRVFSNPGILDDWLRKNNIDPKDRAGLITSAGNCAPGFTKENGQAEVFVHAPFAFKKDDEEIDQNNASLVLHITFFEGERSFRAFFGADVTNEVWDKIVYKTKRKKRDERLIWDIFKVSHHCSYTALSDEKGKEKTKPIENVEYLFEQGQDACCIIASSTPIPSKDTDQPPHRQAAAYYKNVAEAKGDRENFLVTMEIPSITKPEPIVMKINKNGVTWLKITGMAVAAAAVTSKASPRQGSVDED